MGVWKPFGLQQKTDKFFEKHELYIINIPGHYEDNVKADILANKGRER